MFEGNFFMIYEGSDVKNIVIKLIPHQYPDVEPPISIKVDICVADGEWQQEQTLPKEGLELHLGDRFRVKDLVYLFIDNR